MTGKQELHELLGKLDAMDLPTDPCVSLMRDVIANMLARLVAELPAESPVVEEAGAGLLKTKWQIRWVVTKGLSAGQYCSRSVASEAEGRSRYAEYVQREYIKDVQLVRLEIYQVLPATPSPTREAEVEKRLREERDTWRRKYFEMEKAQSQSIDTNGEHVKPIQRLERDKDEIRNHAKEEIDRLKARIAQTAVEMMARLARLGGK